MGRGADRIAHVVQTIEHGDQVVVFAWKCFGLRDPKVEAKLETLFGGGSAGALRLIAFVAGLNAAIVAQKKVPRGLLLPLEGLSPGSDGCRFLGRLPLGP
jgi:hypothetical protein